jgi:DNA-binding response OmpR family regulator/predicted regulator of Ras-like GTPase activity (Roadblock/LC7/MglB family)
MTTILVGGKVAMTEQWQILVVEDDEQLNQNIVNSLHKDGYLIQGARSGAEAIRMLWSEEFDVVIGNLKTPGADGFEMLQWLRTFRPRTRMIMIAAPGPNAGETRTQALEAGVVSYLEKPLNLHQLKEELRRLLQQTGFSANLDSFDLLDVIQIVTMSRKNIALLVNTGLEERGTLRFQGGELIWAEYGTLRGEEAFFALAAYKNGTVMYQPWNEQITPNVTLPLSRLIFQALQYRTKYAAMQQATGEQAVLAREPQRVEAQAATLSNNGDEIDDSPMLVLVEEGDPESLTFEQLQEQSLQSVHGENGENTLQKEWWQRTDKHSGVQNGDGTENPRPFPHPIAKTPVLPPQRLYAQSTQNANTPVPAGSDQLGADVPRTDLPSWLTEQPPKPAKPNLRPSALSTTAQMPAAPLVKPHPAEWQPPANIPQTPTPITKQPTQPIARTTESFPAKEAKEATAPRNAVSTTGRTRRAVSPEWQSPEPVVPRSTGETLQSLSPARKKSDDLPYDENQRTAKGRLIESAQSPASTPGVQRSPKRNYPALVAALQTLGYTINGFIAAAVVSMDGQPIAQVAVDELDISQLCKPFSIMLQSTLQSLEQQQWGAYERMVITSANRHILLNVIGDAPDAFQVLITTREADLVESQEVMENVAGAIGAALK